VVPEKQGLKPPAEVSTQAIVFRLSSGSRKTRIETKKSEYKAFGYPRLSSGSRKTRIETRGLKESSERIVKSKQWFQKNKD